MLWTGGCVSYSPHGYLAGRSRADERVPRIGNRVPCSHRRHFSHAGAWPGALAASGHAFYPPQEYLTQWLPQPRHSVRLRGLPLRSAEWSASFACPTPHSRSGARGARPSTAQTHVDDGLWPADEALGMAIREIGEILSAGRDTPGHRFWTVHDDQCTSVGVLWIAQVTGRADRLFIYDIWIDPERRGQGLGAATLAALEALARAEGVRDRTARIGLECRRSPPLPPQGLHRDGHCDDEAALAPSSHTPIGGLDWAG